MDKKQEDTKYYLPREIAVQCLACCVNIRDGILSNPHAQDALELVGRPEIIEDAKEFIDYIQALVDSGVPTVTVPEEMRKTYDFLYNLTMKMTIQTIILGMNRL